MTKNRLLSTGFGEYDLELNASKQFLRVKKIKMDKKSKNMRLLSTGIGNQDLELNYGKNPLRIRNSNKVFT